jgi:arginine decarboxylase
VCHRPRRRRAPGASGHGSVAAAAQGTHATTEIQGPMATITSTRSPFLHGQWTTDDSARLYGLAEWGKGYFGVNALGHLTVMPGKDPGRQIDLFELIEGLRERDLHTPVLLRFTDILFHRLREIKGAFDAAIRDNDYKGAYRGIYPIKVNQQRHIVEEIRNIGTQLGFGLEAGSKPELLAVLALTEGHNEMPIVCNGFKDDEFIETVILATKLGRFIVPVVERFSDLELIVKHATRYGVRPRIGVRVKPSARGTGKWESTSGPRSKFGLFVGETIKAVEYLKQHGMADCLNMLHFHIGSQVGDIRVIKNAVNELSHIYTELVRLGGGLNIINIGGGMGIDYDGSQSAWESSVNYTAQEYAADVVYRIKSACDQDGIAHPTIMSESGRAMVAYSSVLVFDVLGKSRFEARANLDEIKAALSAEEEKPQPVLDLIDAYERLTDRNIVEVYHDAMQARDEAMSLFSLGYLSLPMRAATEALFWAICRQALSRAGKLDELPEEFRDLPEMLSDIYYCNFSVFQSMPDAWAIDQLFPITPIHRLKEQPQRHATLADISCDSDGKVDLFVDKRDIKKTLELHDLREGEPYYLGVFLVGAYQEVLGDLHNLLGDTHAVHVSLDEEGRYSIDEVVEGDTVKEVLGYVQFDVEDLEKAMRRDIERAVRTGAMGVQEGQSLLKFYEQGIEGYTYLE